MVLTSFAFVLGQICIGVLNWFRQRRPDQQPRWHAEAGAQLTPGQVLPFRYPGEHEPCLLLRLPDNQGKLRYAAYDQHCTHLSCGVLPDPHSPDKLFCPCHHGYFDCATGRPVAGPPRRPLPLIELEERNGDLYAVAVKERTT